MSAQTTTESSVVTEHDVLVGYRLRLLTLAAETGNVSEACRLMGVPRLTDYRCKRQVDRWGREALNVGERRRPRMPNEIGPHLEQRIIAFLAGAPGVWAAADQRRAGPGEVGRPADLRARHLAGPVPRRAQHARQTAGVDRAAPRPV
ncbi:MAG: helix-turn-helix domain-containing protein [Solirubrobacteraceae bacterium]